MKNTISILFAILALNIAFCQDVISVGEKHKIHSEVLDEEREIWLGLPALYDSLKEYPTIYVMDAEWQFDIILALTKELAANDKIPAHIVIGIPHVDVPNRLKDLTFTGSEVNSDGELDSVVIAYFNNENTGGGPQFYSHLTDEVMHFINSNYGTNGFDVFLGHSLSGYFGAYILSMETPFEAFQLYDPSVWYNQADAITHLTTSLPANFNSNVFIATAAGGRDKAQYNIDTHASLHETLKKAGVNSQLKVYANEDHGSVRLPAVIDGLSDLYLGYSHGYILATDTITVADSEAHYQAFSEKVNFLFTCPIDTYRWIGYANNFQGNWDEALKAYNKCEQYYSIDVNVCSEIANCYYHKNDYEQSLVFYQKALSIDPDNEDVQAKVDELKVLTSKIK